MWNAARAATKNSFDFHMDELKKLDVKTYEWLVKLDVRTRNKHAFNIRSKSDTLVNNIVKSFSAWILEARDKLTMMEIIKVMIMQRLQTKRDHMRRYEGRVCPRIHKKLDTFLGWRIQLFCVGFQPLKNENSVNKSGPCY